MLLPVRSPEYELTSIKKIDIRTSRSLAHTAQPGPKKNFSRFSLPVSGYLIISPQARRSWLRDRISKSWAESGVRIVLGDVVLELVDVGKSFGGLRALDGLSFQVREGEILGLIGPNGSGKSTAFNVITGALSSDSGTVVFSGEDITGLAPHRISRLGISRTFQVVRPFPHLTAFENVLAGRLFGGLGASRGEESREAALVVLARVGLADKADHLASSFTIVERKWLEVARALASTPRLMLLDEFMAGLTPHEIPGAVGLVKSLRDSGVTIVVVEHVIKAITGACDRVVVLDAGKKLAEGSPDEIVNDHAVIEAYLGTRHARG
jgi:branched-chain amino acid transport system ATP-binding protein